MFLSISFIRKFLVFVHFFKKINDNQNIQMKMVLIFYSTFLNLFRPESCLTLEKNLKMDHRHAATERINKTTAIEVRTADIEEMGIKLRLTIVDTPGKYIFSRPPSRTPHALFSYFQ